MQNPELDVKQVSTASEDRLFLELVAPVLKGNSDCSGSYRLRHIIPCAEGMAYAVYEKDHNILPVQFTINGETLVFGYDERSQIMSLDEIRLIRELGETVIDGTPYSIENTTLCIVDNAGGCQHMIVFELKNKD